MTARCRQPGGFAAVTAIMLIGLVATTLAAMAMTFAADARRTRAAATDAQLRQLLIAGAADVQQRLGKGEATLDIQSAAPADGVVRVTAAAKGDAVEAVVVATIGKRTAQQTLRFTRAADGWKLHRVNVASS